MHITGGQARGLRIETPPGNITRPTTDRVRESVFAILRDLIPDAQVIDLYAGSGSLGLEAASRGAEHVTWVEKHPATAALISQNFARLAPAGVTTRGAVKTQEVLSFLRGSGPESADLVFADPPYDKMRKNEELQELLRTMEQSRILKEDGILILEVGGRTRPVLPNPWNLMRKEEYGSTAILFLDYSE
ncbi:MAG: 16S rRNA (guanine(966)-N(2))-methyltransferase RsmD [Verrucomicrobia bacterium]|nr:16S rRNA (guanine(966)-N(2))-methyltransferase RsmD [Verrucomicrobiota bacterium]MCH8526894.1 16S rRNA (guanine(966)-N(2))-methyltransferase RsmD [Kiritimatiellia bacterium]